MNLKGTEWEGMYWVHVVQDFDKQWAVMNTVPIFQTV
jgi:hypothetical protein